MSNTSVNSSTDPDSDCHMHQRQMLRGMLSVLIGWPLAKPIRKQVHSIKLKHFSIATMESCGPFSSNSSSICSCKLQWNRIRSRISKSSQSSEIAFWQSRYSSFKWFERNFSTWHDTKDTSEPKSGLIAWRRWRRRRIWCIFRYDSYYMTHINSFLR